jgi:hypothetical protein
MRKSITICAITSICSMVALFPAATTALAQAGSTGGTLGKTDKSASGGEERQDKHPSRRAAAAKQEGNGCNKVVGSWQWNSSPGGTAVVDLNANGTSTATNNDTGTWTCTGRTVVIRWKATTDTIVLSSDGKKMIGSSVPWNVAVTATRL